MTINEQPVNPEEIVKDQKQGQSSGPDHPSDMTPAPLPVAESPLKRPLASQWQRKWLRLEATHPEIQSAANHVESWVARVLKNDKSGRHIVLCGPSGTGKTHMAEAAKKYLSAARMSEVWGGSPVIEMMDFTRVANYDDDGFWYWKRDRINDIAGAGIRVEIMFLEDIGCEFDRYKSGVPTARLTEILNDFRDRWLFVTTNVQPEGWPARWDSRVADRLFRDAVIVDMRNVVSWQIAKESL